MYEAGLHKSSSGERHGREAFYYPFQTDKFEILCFMEEDKCVTCCARRSPTSSPPLCRL